jgi:hydroxyquinol 1,2-dioxygenase
MTAMVAYKTQHAELLADVFSRHDNSPNPRVREITLAAVKHLHAFVEEVGLQRDEWFKGIQMLTAIGQKCDDVRQEFILLSDTLGVSALVEFVSYDGALGTTENTVLGPWYVPGSPERAFGASMLEDPDDGDQVVVRGRVTDADGQPLANAVLDCWQNGSDLFYAVQRPDLHSINNLRGIYRTNANGEYEIRAVRPLAYPIPSDGPVGDMLRANNRNWWRPGHLHVWAKADGYKDLVTHIFDEASEHLNDDAVFGMRPSLVRAFTNDANGDLVATFDVKLDKA